MERYRLPSPHEIVARTFGDFERYFIARVTHSEWELEDETCALHGLRYGLLECRLERDQAPLLRELRIDEDQARWSPTDGPDNTLRDFLSRNRPYFAQLNELFRSCTFGSP
jgi:hypothetical protein